MKNENLGIVEIRTGFKNNKLNYDDAVQRLDAFSKQGLIWWILNSTLDTPEIKLPDMLSEYHKNLPKDNPYNDIKM